MTDNDSGDPAYRLPLSHDLLRTLAVLLQDTLWDHPQRQRNAKLEILNLLKEGYNNSQQVITTWIPNF